MAGQRRRRVDEFYEPEILTVEVGTDEDKQAFKVPRALICEHSKYCEKAFADSFAEGQNRLLTLEHVTAWTFEVFVGWLYSRRIESFHDPEPETDEPLSKKAKTDGEQGSSQTNDNANAQRQVHDATTIEEVGGDHQPKGDDDNGNQHVPDRHDPVTWEFGDLFTIYNLGDYLDCKAFREAVMDIIQIKSLQRKPRQYLTPSFVDMAIAFDNLPDSSPLYRFLLDFETFDTKPEDLAKADMMLVLPPTVLVKMLSLARQLSKTKDCDICMEGDKTTCQTADHPDVKGVKAKYYYDLCAYHEHESEDERDACRAKWVYLKEKHDMDVERPEKS